MQNSQMFMNGRMKAEREITNNFPVFNGAPPSAHYTASSQIKSHPQFSQTDYDYFRGKGYSDAEILRKWDSEKGSPPTDWKKHQFFKPY